MAALSSLGKIFRSDPKPESTFAPMDIRPYTERKKKPPLDMGKLAEEIDGELARQNDGVAFLDAQFIRDEKEDNPSPGGPQYTHPLKLDTLPTIYTGKAALDFLAADLEKLSAQSYLEFQREVNEIFKRRKTLPISYLTRALFVWATKRNSK